MFLTNKVQFAYANGTRFNFPDLNCKPGEAQLLIGASGVGKTSYLNVMAGLEKALSGSLVLNGEEYSKYSSSKMDAFRASNIALIQQQPVFIAGLNVLDNVLLASYFSTKITKGEALDMLAILGIDHLRKKLPYTLSVGEQQRLGIARALIKKPKLVLADEPSSALDDENTQILIETLNKLVHDLGAALIVITHDQRLKLVFKNQVHL